jgi:phosphopantetheinyl transferase
VTDIEACEKGRRRQARFTELWTLKEAYLKALGVGLLQPLHEIAFNFADPSGIRATEDGSLLVDWRFDLFAARHSYLLAVAVHTNTSLGFSAQERPEKWDRAPLVPIRSSA